MFMMMMIKVEGVVKETKAMRCGKWQRISEVAGNRSNDKTANLANVVKKKRFEKLHIYWYKT